MGYEFSTRIRYSETDERERLTLDHLADYFQDTAIFHDQDAGMGTAYWIERGAMWVLTSWKILIYDLPLCSDPVTLRTDATGFRRFVGTRNFTMRGAEGKILAAAFSKWALLDIPTLQPTDLSEDEIRMYGIAPALPIEEEKRRIFVPENALAMEPITVLPHHLDANHHVNNVQFILMAMNYLPKDFETKTMRVSYHKSAQLGEVLYPKFHVGEHEVIGALLDGNGETHAAFRFTDSMSEADRAVERL